MSTLMASRMPGDWPRTSMEESQAIHRLQVPRIFTHRQPSLHSSPSVSSSSSSSSHELFFEVESAISDTSTEAFTPSLPVLEPVVESVERNESIDWWRYDPPSELFRVQGGTSEELQGVIPRSIERLRSQHAREEERRVAAARNARPLTRTTNITGRQKRKVVPTEIHPLENTSSSSDPDNLSATSSNSDDSGYRSMSPATSSSTSTSSTSRRPFNGVTNNRSKGSQIANFSLGFLFRRKDNAQLHVEITPNGGTRETLTYLGIPASPSRENSVYTSSTDSTTECVSCLDDFASNDMIKLTCHSYCSECFQRLISNALETEAQWPAKCCLNPIPSETILPKLDHAKKAKYKQREAEWSIPTSDRIYCAHARCNEWIPPQKINTATNTAKCKSCSRKTCILCRGEAHNAIECPQDPSLQQTRDLAEIEGWKRCYQCNAYVEHNQGCRHMTCRCKAEFCYICSARWRTCSCTDAQLTIAQQEANTRRQERTNRETMAAAEVARQEAAAEEERIILQMVADFEREEAEREAAAIEAQRLRDEEARLQREEEDRRIEERRIASIGERFRQLAAELEALNEVQEVLMAERYEFESEQQRKERQHALDALVIRHSTELEALAFQSRETISDAENSFHQEYQSRLEKERQIQQQYVDELTHFWDGKPDGEQKVVDAKNELRQEAGKQYKLWYVCRRKQISAVKETEKRNMESLIAKHAAEIKVIEGRTQIDTVEWKRKVWAEEQWVGAVTRSRANMLSEMELVEYARA